MEWDMKLRNMKLLAGALLSGVVASATAGTIRHDMNDLDYQNFGNTFAPVGEIIYSNSHGYYGCSATAIGTHWLLTAGHCVNEAQTMDAYLPNSVGGYSHYQGSNWVANEHFNLSNSLAGWDIGLVYFNQAMDVTPAQIYRQRDEVGGVGVITGFGRTGDGLTGTVGDFGTKRAGLNALSFAWSTEGDGQQLLFGDFDPPADNNPNNALDLFEDGYALPFEYSPSFGDSGGGLFVYRDNQFYLAGVNSFINDANGNTLMADYGDFFAATRVSSFSDWIDQKLNRTHAPEPSGWLLMLTALGSVLIARRQRV